MAYGTVTFFSNVLGQDMSVDYLLPDTRRRASEWKDWNDKKLPVIWILHGNGDSNNAWIRKSDIELYARQFDVAVIMPSCGRECYTDSKRGLNYFTYVTEELPMVMRNYLPISRKREENFIMGNSMGGYGAFKCALNYPDRYAAMASFSGAAAFNDELKNGSGGMGGMLTNIFGSYEEYKDSINDLNHLLEDLTNKKDGDTLKVYQCCGAQDFLIEANRKLSKVCEQYIPEGNFTYVEGDGGHDWFYWNPQIENVFKFFGFDVDHCWDDSGIVRKK